jgi:SAM-dependent methyltransferase
LKKAAQLHPYPVSYWDAEASEWDRIVAMPTNPHQFYYYEADLLLSEILADSMRVLELGCGTGGSTSLHAPEVRQLVATDFSQQMVRRAARKVRRRISSAPDFAVAEASHLPFRDSSFDAVISRGVLMSYIENPVAMLAEMHRVLRADGKVGLDAMNRIPSGRPKVTRGFRTVSGKPCYTEFFVRAGRQVRLVFVLAEGSPYGSLARDDRECRGRPRNLRKYVAAEMRFEGRLFRPRELTELLREAGFRDVRVIPLGHLAYSQGWKNKKLQRIVSSKRRELSELMLALSEHLRPETALHLFVTASRS